MARIVAATPGSAAWQQLLAAHADRFARDQIFSQAVLGHILAAARGDDKTVHQRLQRWCEDAGQRTPGEPIEPRLLAARDDDEVRALLAKVPKMVTPFAVRDSIRQADELLRAPSPLPLPSRARLADGILRVARVVAEVLPDERLVAEVRYAHVRVPMVLDDLATALTEMRTCAELFERLGDRLRTAQCVGTVGTLALRLGRIDEAGERLQASLALLGEGESEDAIRAPTYEELAQIAARRQDLPAAGRWFAQAAALRAALGHLPLAAKDSVMAITPLAQSRDHDGAHAATSRFLALRGHLPNGPELRGLTAMAAESVAGLLAELVVSTLRRSQPRLAGTPDFDASVGEEGGGEVMLDRRWLAEAERWRDAGVQLLDAMPDDRARAVVHFACGLLDAKIGLPDRAGQALAEAMALARRSDDGELFAAAVNARIEAEILAGRHDAAAELVRAEADEVADRAGVTAAAQTLLQGAAALLQAGRVREALAPLERVCALLAAGDDGPATYLRGSAAATRCAIHVALRDAGRAVDAAGEAVATARALGYRRGEAQCLAQLAMVCGMAGEGRFDAAPNDPALLARVAAAAGDADPPASPQALAHRLYRRAIAIYQAVQDPAGEAQAWGNLANLRRDEDPHEALAQLHKAMALLGPDGAAGSRAVVLANLGKLYRRLGALPAAATHLEEALRLAASLDHHDWAYDTAYELGLLHAAAGDEVQAEACLRESIRRLDLARLALPVSDVARLGFAADKQAPAAALAALLLRQGRAADAFAIVQGAKSRTLVELVGLARLAPVVSPADPAHRLLLDEEEALLSTLRASAVGAPVLTTGGTSGVAVAQARLDELYAQLQPIDPEYVAMRRGVPAGGGELAACLAAQGCEVALVDYFVSHEALHVFVLRRGWPAPRCVKVAVDAAALVALRDEFEQQVVRLRGRGPATWQRAAEWLLAPVEPHVAGAELVYLAPHGPLHGLPIHALPLADGRPLIETCEVAYLPAAGLLPLVQRPGKGSGRVATCCAVGVAFEDEARRVAALFGTDAPLLGGVTVQALRAAARGRDVCHFSCHGQFDAGAPRASGLVLGAAPGGDGALLAVDDIVTLDLRAELVVLSACQSGVARVVQGDEQIGILRAFLFAGAGSVVATLWPVEAEAGEAFVLALYEQLLAQQRAGTGPLAKSQALQAAARAMIARYGAEDVYRWAPFFLTGQWRSAPPAEKSQWRL